MMLDVMLAPFAAGMIVSGSFAFCGLAVRYSKMLFESARR